MIFHTEIQSDNCETANELTKRCEWDRETTCFFQANASFRRAQNFWHQQNNFWSASLPSESAISSVRPKTNKNSSTLTDNSIFVTVQGHIKLINICFLISVCRNWQRKNRQDCFSTKYFTSCIQALLLEDEKDKFQEMAEYLGRKK